MGETTGYEADGRTRQGPGCRSCGVTTFPRGGSRDPMCPDVPPYEAPSPAQESLSTTVTTTTWERSNGGFRMSFLFTGNTGAGGHVK